LLHFVVWLDGVGKFRRSWAGAYMWNFLEVRFNGCGVEKWGVGRHVGGRVACLRVLIKQEVMKIGLILIRI